MGFRYCGESMVSLCGVGENYDDNVGECLKTSTFCFSSVSVFSSRRIFPMSEMLRKSSEFHDEMDEDEDDKM